MKPEPAHPVKKLVAISTEMAETISIYRHQHRFSTETEAIRHLIQKGLEASLDPAASCQT
jgi:hypothetical protein